MILIDGAQGEGGGQMLRTALALSALTGKAFEMQNIRANRADPGLKAQHLAAVNAAKALCDAKTNDYAIGSQTLRFLPEKTKGGHYEINIGTAGSTSLLLQALLVPSLFASKKITLTLTGGTCGLHQAPIEYLQHVLLPQLARFCKLECKLLKRGYYPKGAGQVTLEISPKHSISERGGYHAPTTIPPYQLTEQGHLFKIEGVSHASAALQAANVAERQAAAASVHLRKYGVPVTIRTEYQTTASEGSGITLWAISSPKKNELDTTQPIILGADALGERGLRAEAVGETAARELCHLIENGAPTDPHLADQLIPFMALLPGSAIKTSMITEHTRTNIAIVEKFLPVKFSVEGTIISVESTMKNQSATTQTTF